MNFILDRDDLVSIIMSVLCGSIMGFEREYNNKSAGFRTIILICLGSTIFTIVSKHGAGSDDRIAANIITGIGFIGAGVIFKDKFSVLGLTTAAVIWTAAGIGMATGIGYHMLALVLTLFTIIVLSLFGKIEYIIDRLNHSRILSVTFNGNGTDNVFLLKQTLQAKGIKAKQVTMSKSQGSILVNLKLTASYKQFADLNEELVNIESITDFNYY